MLKKNKNNSRLITTLKLSVVLLIVSSVLLIGLFIAATEYLGPPNLEKADKYSKVVLDRHHRLLRAYTTSKGIWRLPVQVEDIDPKLIKMLLAYEDRRFYHHNGVDPLALLRAAWLWAKHGKIISGGSTITMQVARLLEGQKGKAISTKIIQIIRAIQLEQKFTKDQILNLYFTLAPYGGNIEGIRAATLAYFGKEPKRLSPHEIALLVALPQAPKSRRLDRHPENARIGRNRVLNRMLKFGLIPKRDVTRAIHKKIPSKRFDFPILAAHLADTEIRKNPDHKRHILTLDKDLQKSLERLTKDHITKLGPKLSAAILVADHQTGEILSYVGSAGYLDQKRFGYIDMIQSLRSPGSTLKPFVYGLAFEMGLAHPETLIDDNPIQFGTYSPENFDKIYRGTLSLRQALQVSLNVPVIKLLEQVGPARLVSKFKVAGIKNKIPSNLSIGLGGAGIKLQDLAQLYSILPRGGRKVKLHYKRANTDIVPQEAKTQIFSERTSWYVTDILRGTKPPENSIAGEIAFKTGTSYGHRDAWSVGYDGKHIIAVWVGRPDNTATPGLVGLKAAAPLLFQAFQRISPKRHPFKEAPKSAIKVNSSTKLPLPLQHFERRFGIKRSTQAENNKIKIIFPTNHSKIELLYDEEGKQLPIAFKAMGGTLPLSWLVDGTPVPSRSHERHTFWSPDSSGFVKLTVIDAKGKVDSIKVRLLKDLNQ